MKGSASARRLWRRPVAKVMPLVFLSLLVPLLLLVLRNRVSYVYKTDVRAALDSASSSSPADGDTRGVGTIAQQHSSTLDNLSSTTVPTDTADPVLVMGRISSETTMSNVTTDPVLVIRRNSRNSSETTTPNEITDLLLVMEKNTSENTITNETRDLVLVTERNSSEEITFNKTMDRDLVMRRNPSENTDFRGSHAREQELLSHSHAVKGPSGQSFKFRAGESGQSCQREFGSYCLWSVEHKAELNDVLVSKLKDQLYIARAYYPSIFKLKPQAKLSNEMRMNIQNHEHMLTEAITDADLPPHVMKMIEKMEHTITRARSVHVDCTNVHKKLRQILDLAEDEAHFHKRQGAFLYRVGVHTMPKSLHCLLLKLTIQYFGNPLADDKISKWSEFNNSSFQHYVIFSRNVLASSVTINSTVMNSKESGNLIFHLVTDPVNYFAMRFWFSINSFKDSVVRVINVQEFDINDSYKLASEQYPSFSEEFHISFHEVDRPFSAEFTDYISIFGHVHFFLPKIFQHHKKVVVLDDDIVVQRDLSFLWSLNLDGKVNGAMHFCRVRLAQLKNYLGGNKHNKESCIWVSGINVIDLEKWREHNITAMYEKFLHTLQSHPHLSRSAVLPATLLAFQDLTYPLDDSWVLSGLGSNYHLSQEAIGKAAVLHYDGSMKPWLDLGIIGYKKYWKKFLAQGNLFMDQCNINL